MATVISLCRRCGRQMGKYTRRDLKEDQVKRYLICYECRWVGVFDFPPVEKSDQGKVRPDSER